MLGADDPVWRINSSFLATSTVSSLNGSTTDRMTRVSLPRIDIAPEFVTLAEIEVAPDPTRESRTPLTMIVSLGPSHPSTTSIVSVLRLRDNVA